MSKKHFYKVLIVVLGMLIITSISSCGGTRNDEPLVDDQAFPGDPGATTASDAGTDASAEEAEVLRLLGISKDENQATEVTQQPSEEKVEDLQDLVGEKDVQIANLQAQLQERENRIQNLQRMKEERESQAGIASVSSPVTTAAASTFKGLYEQALALYNNRNYQEGLNIFNQLIDRNESNSLVDNCQYWKGECYYGMRNYNQAALEFQKVFMYDDSNKQDDAQLKLGLCYKMLGDVERARAEFNKVINNYPDSEYTQRAQTYLSQL